jgi:Cu+-exporting ATPase
MAKDPVCGMTVDDKAPNRSTYSGRTYVFCCSTCKAKFDKEPARYAAAAGSADQREGRP